VQRGEWPADDNPLHNAPHTAADLMVDEWQHPYPRQLAAFPVGHKSYFPPVSRIDGAAGDRHLVCACPPIDAYVD
jgi:glycine dehydrogenase